MPSSLFSNYNPVRNTEGNAAKHGGFLGGERALTDTRHNNCARDYSYDYTMTHRYQELDHTAYLSTCQTAIEVYSATCTQRASTSEAKLRKPEGV